MSVSSRQLSRSHKPMLHGHTTLPLSSRPERSEVEGPAVLFGIPLRLREAYPKAKTQQLCIREPLAFALLLSHHREYLI